MPAPTIMLPPAGLAKKVTNENSDSAKSVVILAVRKSSESFGSLRSGVKTGAQFGRLNGLRYAA